MPLNFKQFRYNVSVVRDYGESIFNGNAATEAIDQYETCLKNLLGYMEETRRLRQEREALFPKAESVFNRLVAYAQEKFPKDKPLGRLDVSGDEIPGTSVDAYHPFEGNILSGIPVFWTLAGGIEKDSRGPKFDTKFNSGLYHNVSGMLGGTAGLKFWDIQPLDIDRLRHFITVGEAFLERVAVPV